MGRAMLIFVVLMTTVFGSVLISVYKNIGGVPEVLIKNQLQKEAEGVSDFVLRDAVRGANSKDFLETMMDMVGSESGHDMSFTMYYGVPEGSQTLVQPEWKIGNCEVEKITYTYHMNEDNYKVQTRIRAAMQDIEIFREAEMAFSYPMTVLGKVEPNIVYLEFEQVLLFPWLRDLLKRLFGIDKPNFPDSSPNNYGGEFFGFTFWSPTGNDNTKMDDEMDSWEGNYSKRFLKLNGYDHRVEVNRKPLADQGEGFKDLDTNHAFTLLTFAKIDKDGRNSASGFLGLIGKTPDVRDRQGTLLWIPSDPTVTSMHAKPAAAIWFETITKGNAKGKLHFTVTQDTLISGQYNTIDLSIDHTLTAPVWKRSGNFLFGYSYTINDAHNTHPWNSYALTYEIRDGKAWVLGYVNGSKVGEKSSNYPVRAYPSEYGMTLGARDIRKANGDKFANDAAERKQLFGIMDQSGMNDEAFTPTDVGLWHEQVMKSTLMHYIRD